MTVGVVAGSLFGVLGNIASRRQPGRDSVLLIGYVTHMVAFYLIFLTFPADSPLQESEMKPYFTPRLSSLCMAFHSFETICKAHLCFCSIVPYVVFIRDGHG